MLSMSSYQVNETTMNTQYANDNVYSQELKPGTTLLRGQYTIERYLNSGGFGITYLAKDSLNRTVVIKECFPNMICCRVGDVVCSRSQDLSDQFRSIVRHFIGEAQRLAKMDHPNIVGVHLVFEDNETAYMALDYVDGEDLLDIVEDPKQKLGAKEIKALMLKMLDAVYFIHAQGLLHRDISPDNILLDRAHKPVLIDFGAARENETETGRVLSALLAVKEGYSPQEFYLAGSVQGPFSDLYALGATFYHVISGSIPPNCQDRLAAVAANSDDPYQPLTTITKDFDKEFLESIDKALQLFPKDRFQSAQEWIVSIDAERRKEAALDRAQSDESIRKMIRKLVAETNSEMSSEIISDDQNTPGDQTDHLQSRPRLGAIGRIASLLFGSSKRANLNNPNEVQT